MSSTGLAAGTAACALLGWALMIVMAEVLPASEFSAALFGMVLASILAWLIKDSQIGSTSAGVPKVAGVILTVVFLALAIRSDVFVVLEQNTVAGFLGIAIGLSLGIAVKPGQPRRTIATFLCAGIAATLALEGVGFMTAITVLGAQLIVALSLVLFHVSDRQDQCAKPVDFGGGGPVIFKTLDAILAATLLSAASSTNYLIAWCFAMICVCAIGELKRFLGPHVQYAWAAHLRSGFTAAAARTNLGFLLIGGGAVTFAFLVAQTVLEQTHEYASSVAPIMVWLFVSHCGPILMGSSDLFMNITNMRSQKTWIFALWGPVALALIFVVAPQDPVELAMLVAGLQLAYSLHSAIVLGLRHGIWPGITALLQKQLKLT